MKKVICALLALCMVFSMAFTAFADEVPVLSRIPAEDPVEEVVEEEESIPELEGFAVAEESDDIAVPALLAPPAEPEKTEVEETIPAQTYHNDDRTVILYTDNGKATQLSKCEGVDDLNYLRVFKYDENEKLVSCYYENKEECFQFTFTDEALSSVIYTNKTTYTYLKTRIPSPNADNGNNFKDWESFILDKDSKIPEELRAKAAPVEKTDLEKYIDTVDARLFDVAKTLYLGGVETVWLRSGVMIRSGAKVPLRLDVALGADKNYDSNSVDYSRQYTYDENGALVHVAIRNLEGTDTYSIYFQNGKAVYAVHNGKDDEGKAFTKVLSGATADAEYVELCKFALNESAGYLYDAGFEANAAGIVTKVNDLFLR